MGLICLSLIALFIHHLNITLGTCVPLSISSRRMYMCGWLVLAFDADLTKAEQEALAFVYDLRNKFESGDIPLEEPEEKGIFGAFKKAFQQ